MTLEATNIRGRGMLDMLRWAFFTAEGRERVGRIVFFVALAIYGAAYCFQKSSIALSYGNTYHATRIWMDVALAFAGAKAILFTRYRQSEKLLMFVPLVAAVAALITSGFYELLDLMVFIWAAKGLGFKDVCKAAFLIWGISIVVIIMLAAIGVIGWGAEGIEQHSHLVRHSCGFKRWTDFGAAVLVPYMVYFHLRYEKFNVADYVIGVAFAAFLFFFVVSRASAALVIAMLLFAVFAKATRKRPGTLMVTLAIIMVAVVVLTFLLPYLYEILFTYGGTVNKINTVLSNRLHYSYGVIASSPLTPFGQSLDYTNTVVGWTFLDSSFVWLLINEGVVSYACVIALYALLFWCAYKNGNVTLMILVAIVVVAGFGELTTIRLGRNVVLLALLPELEKLRIARRSTAGDGIAAGGDPVDSSV